MKVQKVRVSIATDAVQSRVSIPPHYASHLLDFIANDASNVTWKEWQGAAGDVCKCICVSAERLLNDCSLSLQYLLSKGINKEPGTRPFTDEFLKSLFGTDRVFYILLIFLQILGRYRIWVGGRLETNNLADRSVLEDSVGNQWRHFSTLA